MTTEEQIARVLELDAAATPKPWETAGQGGLTMDGLRNWYDVDCRVQPWVIVKRIRRERKADADLIAEYRTLAPILARKLERAMEVLHGLDTETYWVEDVSQYIEEIEAMVERGVA